MKPWMWKTLVASLATILVVGAAPPSQRAGAKSHGHLFPQIARELGLSEQQRDQLQQLHREKEKQAIGLEAQIRLNHLELSELIDNQAPDRAAIGAKIDEMAGLMAQRKKLEIDTLLDAKQLLTPEQLDRFEELRGRFLREREHDGFQRGRGGRPDGPPPLPERPDPDRF
jgi:Spy/CpxP family protein refolding chaperone